MAVISTTQTFSNGDQVTSDKLNAIVSTTKFIAGAVEGTTLVVTVTGQLKVGTITASEMGANSVASAAIQANAIVTPKVSDGAITAAKLATDSVTTAKIGNEAVTLPKIQASLFATQAQMQSQSSGVFVTPNVLLYHPATVKAYGTVDFNNGSAGITGGYNVTSGADTGTNTRTITLGVTMANTNYIVTANYTGSDSAAIANSPYIRNKTTTSFEILAAGESANRKISFAVFGTIATP